MTNNQHARIHLDLTLNSPKTIKYNVKVPNKLQKYFLKTYFYVTYSDRVEKSDTAILSIPGIGVLLPLALATGSDIVVKSIETTFLDSVEKLKNIVQGMYPLLPAFSTHIIYKNLKRLCFGGNNRIVFFSGGVDSTHMLLRHLDENPYTATVWGSDISLENVQKWAIVKAYVKSICKKIGCKESIFIALDNPLNLGVLEDDFTSKIKGNDLWGGLQAGITLPLLIAPIAESKKIGVIRIASDIPAYFKFSWSGRPEIYNVLSWADVKIICDDSEISRIDKVRAIKRLIEEKGLKDLKLRVCLDEFSEHLNCGVCEKCIRTIAELYLANLDPKELGFDINTSTYLNIISKKLFKHPLSPIRAYFWLEIVKEAKNIKHKHTFINNMGKDLVETLAMIPFSYFVPHEHQISLHSRIRRKICKLYYGLPIVLREKIDPRCKRRALAFKR